MKSLLPSGVALLAGVLLFSACKKNDDDTTPATNSTKIVATWKLSYDATDANGNNAIEVSEQVAPTGGDFEYLTFYSNGTLKDSLGGSVSGVVPGVWSISGDYLTMSALGFSDVAKITQLDNATLIIQDTSEHPAEWSAFTKQ